MTNRQASVLDASASLAYVNFETGREAVMDALGAGAVMSAINWAEVLSRLMEAGRDPDSVAGRLTSEGILGHLLAIAPVDDALARGTARLRPQTRQAGLSLADRTCLALARRLRVPALTADRVWSTLDLGIEIRLIR